MLNLKIFVAKSHFNKKTEQIKRNTIFHRVNYKSSVILYSIDMSRRIKGSVKIKPVRCRASEWRRPRWRDCWWGRRRWCRRPELGWWGRDAGRWFPSQRSPRSLESHTCTPHPTCSASLLLSLIMVMLETTITISNTHQLSLVSPSFYAPSCTSVC